MIAQRNPFIPIKPQRGCQIPSGCQCTNREMAMRCNYWDRREAEQPRWHPNLMLSSVLLGSIIGLAGIIALLWLDRLP